MARACERGAPEYRAEDVDELVDAVGELLGVLNVEEMGPAAGEIVRVHRALEALDDC